MALLHVRNVVKSYGETKVLSGVDMDLERGCRASLVGANGCGKSTLLRILAGQETADGGQIRLFAPAVLLSQSKELDGSAHLDEGLRRRAERTLSQTELPEEETASGGEKTKKALSLALAADAGLLLLDEPTNDLDFDGVNRLLDMLAGYAGGLLVVSHDRYFLDALTDITFELENGQITRYEGNYSAYRRERGQRREAQMHRYESDKREQARVQSAIRDLKSFAQKAHRDSTKDDGSGLKMGRKEKNRARAKKMESRVKSQIKRLEKLKREGEAPPSEERHVYLALEKSERSGRRIVQAQGLALGYGEKRLTLPSDFSLLRGEHMAVFGRNGCGKSTLLKTLLGQIEPLEGDVWRSPGLSVGVLRQGVQDLPREKTALQALQDALGAVDGQMRSLLYQMGLERRHLEQRISSLSLGEQMKVKLAMLILSQSDLLLLDEPTACLDLYSRDALQEALGQYPGTLLIVSHDVYFLQDLCDKCLLFENGRVLRQEYSFREYLSRQGYMGEE